MVFNRAEFAARAPNWLGDSVLAIPAIRALAESSRHGRLVVIASVTSAPILIRIPGTLVFPVTKAGGNAYDSLRSLLRGARLLRAFGPVMVFSFTRSSSSAMMCGLGGVPRRIGFSDGALASLYTDRVNAAHSASDHLTDIYCSLVESVGIRVTERVPVLEPLEEDISRGREMLKDLDLKENHYVCLFPGARYGPAKRWDLSRFALLGDTVIAKFGFEVVILGSKEDTGECQAMEGRMAKPSINLCGKLDLSALVGVLSSSRAVVSNDSGGMHLSASLGIPVVALFFSTDPGWTQPISPRSVVLHSRLPCSPCFRRDCDKGHPCTESITVDQVADALDELVGEET